MTPFTVWLLSECRLGTHKAIRLNIEGKDITHHHTIYKLPDIVFAANDALALLQELSSLHRDVFNALYPDQAKQAFWLGVARQAVPAARLSDYAAGEN